MPAPRKELDPAYRRRLAAAFRERQEAEERFRKVVLQGLDQGQGMSAMARDLDIDRRLLWKWVHRWTGESKG